jgi:hypothetical protein
VASGKEPSEFTSAFHGWQKRGNIYSKWDVSVPLLTRAEYDAFMASINPKGRVGYVTVNL